MGVHGWQSGLGQSYHWDKHQLELHVRLQPGRGVRELQRSGTVGFGTTSISFFEQVSSQINYKAFSYCLPSNETTTGYMNLGDYSGQGAHVLYTLLFQSTFTKTYSLTVEGIMAND
jgi:hypothetical protein